jgi:hypothetical protein
MRLSTRLCLSIGLAAIASTAFAQGEGIKVGATVEVNYTYNTNKTDTGYYFNSRNSQFALNYGEIHIYKDPTKEAPTGFSLRFVDGEVVRGLPLATAPYNTSTRNVYEAYGRFLAQLGEKSLTVDAGIFPGWVGYEVIPTTDQFVSRSYQYGTQPFYHAGVRAAYALSPSTTLTGGFVNRYNGIDTNGNRDLGAGFQLAQTLSENASLTLSGLIAKDSFTGDLPTAEQARVSRQTTPDTTFSAEKQKSIVNVVYTNKLSDSTRIAAEASAINGKDAFRTSYNAQAITGYLYINRAALRAEFLSGNTASAGLILPGDGSKKPNIASVTATYQLSSASLPGTRTLIELRYDNANTSVFSTDKGRAKKNQSTISLMQIFNF